MPSSVIDRGSLDAWQKKGSRSSEQRAAERVEQLLKTYQPNSLTEEARRELHRITLHLAQKQGMDTLPSLP